MPDWITACNIAKAAGEIRPGGFVKIPIATSGLVRTMTMQKLGFVLTAAALTVFGVTGCATKNYVRTQTQPLIDHTGQLDQKTAENNRSIHDLDDRATAGITKA